MAKRGLFTQKEYRDGIPANDPRIAIALGDNTDKEKYKEILATSTSELGLPSRTVNALEDRGIGTVDHVLRLTRKELQRINGIGEKSATQIIAAVQATGIAEIIKRLKGKK